MNYQAMGSFSANHSAVFNPYHQTTNFAKRQCKLQWLDPSHCLPAVYPCTAAALPPPTCRGTSLLFVALSSTPAGAAAATPSSAAASALASLPAASLTPSVTSSSLGFVIHLENQRLGSNCYVLLCCLD